MTGARISRISGALAEVRPLPDAALYEVVHVGERGLMAEVVRVEGDRATLQIYEDTTGLRLGEPARPTGSPLMAELGPGLLGSVLDGVGRRLTDLAASEGSFVVPGTRAPMLDRRLRFEFEPKVAEGATVTAGDVIGEVREGTGYVHPILLPPTVAGTVTSVRAGQVGIEDVVVTLEGGAALTMLQRWPVRRPRPAGRRVAGDRPFVTGQRVLDLLFPVIEGGSVAVPGGFGTGKTVIEQSLAKYAAADVIVFVGCGERGNEMAELLDVFPSLVDPVTGRPVMERTVMVINTSNMPVVAREASVYLGLTIAEYFRDLGLRTAVMVDSLSRWAEALRDIGARLQEMPGEEGYPTYLASRLAKLYERTGRVEVFGRPQRTGALTLVCAVSPPGGDFSEPVTQASLRVGGALWALDASLAHQRQFPAVDWASSYSLYLSTTDPWFAREVDPDWPALRQAVLELLQKDAELREIAGLLGAEALQDQDRWVLAVAALARDHVLGQNAFDPNDAVSTVGKTHALAKLVSEAYRRGARALEGGAVVDRLDLGPLRRALLSIRTSAELEEGLDAATAALAALDGEGGGA